VRQNNINFVQAPPAYGAKPRLLLSFSGGRTSGYMTRMCLTQLADQFEMLVVFANTGQENEQTLEFVRDCDQHFNFGTVWLEAVVQHGERKSSGHRIVTFETASRDGEPFEEMIRKYGIPNRDNPHCTRELKLNAMKSYLRAVGWTDYTTALGIRPDEFRRVDEEQFRLANQGEKVRLAYPLVDRFYADKQDVNDWWEDQPFNLRLLEHEGNCKWCWKKSFAKHARLLAERPEVYTFPARMEALYPRVGAEFGKDPSALSRVFFRERTSTLDLAAKCAAVASKPEQGRFKERPDENGGCTESCELYPMLDFDEAAA
jgi:3'-phosphoadenosine 5'-phosphosulfate sulfotransferase (PAPS reductase)/FAD synthetase